MRRCKLVMKSRPLEEVLQVPSVAEPCPAHTQVLHQTQVLGLMANDALIKNSVPLEIVGLDAANVGRLLAHQDVHQLSQAGLELRASLQGRTPPMHIRTCTYQNTCCLRTLYTQATPCLQSTHVMNPPQASLPTYVYYDGKMNNGITYYVHLRITIAQFKSN